MTAKKNPNEKKTNKKKWDYLDLEEETADSTKSDAGAQVEEVGEVALDVADSEAIQALKEALEAAEQERDVLKDKWIRSQAEMKNVRYVAQKNASNQKELALKGFVQEMVAVVDNFERCLRSFEDHGVDAETIDGVNLVYKSLLSSLEINGVVFVSPLGESFNPELHEAMSLQPDGESKPNTVLSVLQRGCTLNSRLIRPARVVVSKALGS